MARQPLPKLSFPSGSQVVERYSSISRLPVTLMYADSPSKYFESNERIFGPWVSKSLVVRDPFGHDTLTLFCVKWGEFSYRYGLVALHRRVQLGIFFVADPMGKVFQEVYECVVLTSLTLVFHFGPRNWRRRSGGNRALKLRAAMLAFQSASSH